MINQLLRKEIKKSRVVIVVHEFVSGVGLGYDLLQFFLKHSAREVLYVSHPLLSTKETYQNDSRYEWYKNGKLKKNYKTFHFFLPEQFLYIKDFLYTLYWGSKGGDIFIGLDPLNALAGIILRQLGLVKKVVYYSIDYYRARFTNKFMNYTYHLVDKVCVSFADETWNVGTTMAEAREKINGMDRKTYNRQYVVPIGVWFDRVKLKPMNKINKRKLIYAGLMIDYMGIDLAIKSLPQILKKLPDVELEIIGMGVGENDLKNLVKSFHLDNHVRFYGFMNDKAAYESKISDGAIGLATFNTEIDDKIEHADPTKIKDYTLCGMPVITTKSFATYKEIEKEKCGFVINYNVNEFVSAVIKLLGNQATLKKYRENARRYAAKFDWNSILSPNLERLLDLQ